jgi:hypothetical protein
MKASAKQAVGVLDGAALQGRTGIAKEASHGEILLQLLMAGELGAVVEGDRTPGGLGQGGEGTAEGGGGEARYDGIFVLRTNARITPLHAVLRYRDLLQVEDLFRRAKAVLRTRPIHHSSDDAIQR